MADKNKAITEQIDALIKEVKDNPDISENDIADEINKLQDDLNRAKADKDEATQQTLQEKIDGLTQALADSVFAHDKTLGDLMEEIKAIEIPAPQVTVQPPEVTVNVPEIKVPETKIPTINVPKPQVNFPESFSIKRPSWLPKIDLSPITGAIDRLIGAIPQVKWPTAAKDAIAVRLSDGKKFYVAIATAATAISDILTFKTADGAKAAALVDTEGRIQLSGLTSGVDYDYLDVQQTDSDTETFVFKTGGASGTTVQTIVINYTSSAKTDIDNVSWS